MIHGPSCLLTFGNLLNEKTWLSVSSFYCLMNEYHLLLLVDQLSQALELTADPSWTKA